MVSRSPNRDEVRAAAAEEPFILTAMISLLGGTLWMWMRRELFLDFFYLPQFLALAHLITLGFITSLIMGILVRILPMTLGVTVRSVRLLRLQYALFLVGSAGMIFHFWISGWLGMAWATVLVLAAASIQVYNLSGVWRSAAEGNWVARYVAAALVNLVLAASLGVLIGFDKVYNFLGGSFISNLYAHAHLAALGWVTTMIFGFQLKLVPTTVGAPAFLPLRFALLEVGTLGLVATFLADVSWQAPFAAMILIAVVWHVFGPIRAFLSGRGREWETLAHWILALLALTGMLLALGFPAPGTLLRTRVQFAYGYAGLLGWIALTITTSAFKLFPIWVWQERFQADFGKKPVPGMKDLYDHRIRVASHLSLFAGVAGAVLGILAMRQELLSVALALVFLGVVFFVANFVLMARWALLRIEFRPRAADWKKFQNMFPGKTQDR